MTVIISEKDLFYIKKGFISKVLYAKESSKKYSKVLVFNISPAVSNYLLSVDCGLSGQEDCGLCPRDDFPSGRLPRRPFYQGLVGKHHPRGLPALGLEHPFKTGPDKKRGLLSLSHPNVSCRPSQPQRWVEAQDSQPRPQTAQP